MRGRLFGKSGLAKLGWIGVNPDHRRKGIGKALLKCQHPNLPTGHCIIAATAKTNKASVLSDDPHFAVQDLQTTWI